MNLEWIITDHCPICGCADVIAESVKTCFGENRIWRHTNGRTRECRTFLCGYSIMYNPNFLHEEVVSRCRQDPEVLARNRLKHEAHKALQKFMNEAPEFQQVEGSVRNNILDGFLNSMN